MTALGQRIVSAVLVVAFASLYQWHGGKAALFLSVIAFLMFTGGLLLHWFGPRRIHIRRKIHANRIEAGEQVRVLVELEFNCRIPLLWIVLCENTPAGVHRKLIFPGTRRQFSYQYECSGLRRGVYRWDTGRLYWGDMFGWNTLSAETAGGTPLIVVPQATAWGKGDSVEFKAMIEGTLSERRNSQGNRSPEFREYQQGDPLGRVHWKSTAKTGKLQTFLPDTTDLSSLGILVYEGASGYDVKQRENLDVPAFERVVLAAARWIHTAERDDIPYHLWMEGGDKSYDAQYQWQHGPFHADDENHGLDKLAEARISKAQSGSVSLRTEMLDGLTSGSRIVVLTGKMDPVLAEWIITAIGSGYRVEVQLTEADQNQNQLGSTDRLMNGLGYDSLSLERLRHSGVLIHAVTDVALSSLGKVEVTDVGA
ncbi:DUF58 domain-containing protein [Paenibacillus sp. FSL R5-0766]|uniref:DUF58 domain-containing protein n=1 Tax=unclassified Paenibacillus TaxID=185978 RepID=UPI00096CE4B6|nr:DUF58 domain-containing protein [Paenibacillus sp. FSL R5-0765]OMF54962.1 hypothetical protein BK141_28845 [Paenibacillus sp. FSL R5-0765]